MRMAILCLMVAGPFRRNVGEHTNNGDKVMLMTRNVVALRDAIDAEACREAEAISRHRTLTGVPSGRGHVKHWELRHGLEKLEGERRFDALFKEN